jgi:hypothetical protein
MLGLHFSDWAIIALVLMLAVFMLWQVRATKIARSQAKAQPNTFLDEIKRQSDVAERQLAAIERIATALQKRNYDTRSGELGTVL